MKKKIIIFLCSFTLLLSLVFPVHADETHFTLRDIFGSGNLSVYVYPSDGSAEYQATTSWNWANGLVIYAESGVTNIAIDINQLSPSLYQYVNDNDIIFFRCRDMTLTGGFSDPAYMNYFVTYEFRFEAEAGGYLTVSSAGNPGKQFGTSEPSFKRPYVIFGAHEFSVPVPNGSRRLSDISIKFTFPKAAGYNGTAYQVMSWGGFDLYVGDSADAPMYTPPSSAEIDDLNSAESTLDSDTEAGRDEAVDIVTDGASLVTDQNGIIYSSLMFVTSFFNDIYDHIPHLPRILLFSLSLGVVVFVLGSGIIQAGIRSYDKNNKGGKK